jgi:hypothetical protein
MGSQHQALAAAMPDDFPNLETVYLYISPVTSTEDSLRNITLDYHPPDIVKITHLCELYFSWATTESIIGKFESGLFQAVLMATFCDEVVRREADTVLGLIPLIKVCAISTAVSLCCHLTCVFQLPSYFSVSSSLSLTSEFTIGLQHIVHGILHREVEGSIENLQQLVRSSLRGLREVPTSNSAKKCKGPERSETQSSRLKMWVPMSMLIALTAVTENHLNLSTSIGSASSLGPRLNIDLSTLRHAFAMPTIDASTFAILIQHFLPTTPASTSLIPVTRTFLEAISMVPNGEAIYQLLCCFVITCYYLPPTISHEYTLDLVDHACKALVSREQNEHTPSPNIQTFRSTANPVGETTSSAIHISSACSSREVAVPTFANFCASIGLEQGALQHFEDGS